jgi:hypothetical protein
VKEIVGRTESDQGEANHAMGTTTTRIISARVGGKMAVLMMGDAAAALVPEMACTPAFPSMSWTMCWGFRTTTLKTVSRICTVR